MRQVLFYLPWVNLPIYGYGLMLFIAMLLCTEVAARRAEREGRDRRLIHDLSLWLFIPGILGARIFYMVQYWHRYDRPWIQFFEIWNGGLVLFGGAIGALIGLLCFARQRKVSVIWLLDVVAPAMALGVGLGRIGCLLYGCCYGDVCDAPWGLSFPPPSLPYTAMVERGLQTRTGFVVLDDMRILAVIPGTDAERQGVKPGDEIAAIDGILPSQAQAFQERWRTIGFDDRPFELTLFRNGTRRNVVVTPPHSPRLQPTQIFSSIDGFLLYFFLISYVPFRRYEGELIGWFGMLHATSRFFIEFLRSDEKTLFDGLTISQNISILIFLGGLALFSYARISARPSHLSPTAGPA